MANLTGRIDHALTLDAPDDAVRAIKTAVLEELRRLDPALDEIAILGDFNHSYRPDFVINWGSGQGSASDPFFSDGSAGSRRGSMSKRSLIFARCSSA